MGWQFWAPRRLPGLDRGEHHHHCPLLPSWGRRGPGHRPAPSPGSAVLFSWGGAAGARARGRHAGTGRTARRSASTSRPNTRRQAGPAPGGLFRAAPLCPLSLPRMLPAGKGQPWPPSPCLSPSPNPIHLPSPVLGSSYPRQPPLTPAPTSGLPPLLQHPRGSPKWRWQQAGIRGHWSLAFLHLSLHPPRMPQTLKQGPRLLPPEGDQSNTLPGPPPANPHRACAVCEVHCRALPEASAHVTAPRPDETSRWGHAECSASHRTQGSQDWNSSFSGSNSPVSPKVQLSFLWPGWADSCPVPQGLCINCCRKHASLAFASLTSSLSGHSSNGTRGGLC